MSMVVKYRSEDKKYDNNNWIIHALHPINGFSVNKNKRFINSVSH